MKIYVHFYINNLLGKNSPNYVVTYKVVFIKQENENLSEKFVEFYSDSKFTGCYISEEEL